MRLRRALYLPSLSPAHISGIHTDALSCCPLPAAPRPARCLPPGQTCAQVEWASGAAGAGRSASAGRPARIGPTAPRSPRSPTQARWPISTPGARRPLPSRLCARASHCARPTHRFCTRSPPCPALALLAPLRALTYRPPPRAQELLFYLPCGGAAATRPVSTVPSPKRVSVRACAIKQTQCVWRRMENGGKGCKELIKASMMRDPALRVVVRDAYGVTILNVEQIRSN